MYWLVLIIIFIIIQLEAIYFFIMIKEDDKSIRSLGKWIIELSHKVEEVVYNEAKETKDINEILNKMLNIDNPYQE